MGLLIAVVPVLAAQEAAEPSQAKHGVRFVVCTTWSGGLPTPLYAKVGKEYQQVQISKVMPSQRIAPEGGVIKFYSSIPATKKGGKAAKAEPVLTISIPSEHLGSSAKSLCVLEPRKDNDTEPHTHFLKESDFKLGGVHVVNLTHNTLEMVTDPAGKFDDKAAESKVKRAKIGGRVRGHNISPKDGNVWSYVSQGKVERLPFVLQALPAIGRGEPTRICAATLRTITGAAQISIVANHPTQKGTYTLLSVQFNDDTPQAKAADAPKNER